MSPTSGDNRSQFPRSTSMAQALRRAVVLLPVLAALAPAPAALASGGVNSGGVNSGGVNSGGVNSGGGGGGSTTTTTTTTTPSSCARIASFSNSNGYYSVWAAIWTSFSISNSCL